MKKREYKSKKRGRRQTGSNLVRVETVWTHLEFARELERAKEQGARNLLNGRLLALCCGIHNYFGHFWADARPFFVELWARIETKNFPHSKSEACDRIGCSMRWAQKIVAGTARPPGSPKNPVPEDWTNSDYFAAITHYSEKTLRPLHANGERERCSRICKMVQQGIAKIRTTKHIAEIEDAAPRTTEETN
jgi:hypothetical protein